MWVPVSAMVPSVLRTTMRSAIRTVEKRWETRMVMAPTARRSSAAVEFAQSLDDGGYQRKRTNNSRNVVGIALHAEEE